MPINIFLSLDDSGVCRRGSWLKSDIEAFVPFHMYQVKPGFFTMVLTCLRCCNCSSQLLATFYLLRRDDVMNKQLFNAAHKSYRRVLNQAKSTFDIKTQNLITSQKLGSRDFRIICNSVFNKSKSILPPLFNSLEVLTKLSCVLRLFLKTLPLMILGQNFHLELIGILKAFVLHMTDLGIISTLREEILAGRKFGGFGENPSNLNTFSIR